MLPVCKKTTILHKVTLFLKRLTDSWIVKIIISSFQQNLRSTQIQFRWTFRSAKFPLGEKYFRRRLISVKFLFGDNSGGEFPGRKFSFSKNSGHNLKYPMPPHPVTLFYLFSFSSILLSTSSLVPGQADSQHLFLFNAEQAFKLKFCTLAPFIPLSQHSSISILHP